MKSFLYGWRNKIGCVTLLIALAMMGLWIRSRAIADKVAWGRGRLNIVVSSHSRLSWMGAFGNVVVAGLDWTSTSIPPDQKDGDWHFKTLIDLQEKAAADGRRASPPGNWTIQYWQVVMPVTLLAGYLLLWKPRKRV